MSGVDNPEITITLRRSDWDLVLRHLVRGMFVDVVDVINAISVQANPQIEAAMRANETSRWPTRWPAVRGRDRIRVCSWRSLR
jgi:hypothetical protein